jgi:methionine synthase / methylenetetrahydrofolate reductase(NADPH)
MEDILGAMEAGPLLADGGIGSYIFELTGRLSEGRSVYEALNLDNPGLIRSIHDAYLQAGARCLTTNTFSANRTSLAQADLAVKAAEVNRAGVRLAREAAADFKSRNNIVDDFFILASVGPAPDGARSPSDASAVYADQVAALSVEAPSAILLETFSSMERARPAIEAIKSVPGAPPVILHLALHHQRDRRGWTSDPIAYVKQAAALGVRIVGVNCCAPWEAAAFVDAVKDTPEVRNRQVLLSVMPNAGGFERIGHRFLSRVNPEFMGKLARELAAKDVRLIGGCCEVHPPHIAEMRNYLHQASAGGAAGPIAAPHGKEPAGASAKQSNGKFSAKLFTKQFAVSVEVLPPRGTGPKTLQEKADFIASLAASGMADAVDITDGSRGIALMPPGDFIAIVRDRLGWSEATGDAVELIPHFTTRDLNAMGLQSRLVGYHSRRIRNVLFITGDPPKMSPTYPRSSGVFDLDSVALIRYAHSYLNAGLDFGGQPLGRSAEAGTRFTIGTGAEPEAINRERELEKLRRKVDAGVDYIFTQPVFHQGPLGLMDEARKRVPVFAGVMVLTGLDHARRIAQTPGVVMPHQVLDRIGRFEHLEDQAKACVQLAIEQVRQVRRQGWSGLYLMSPSGHEPVLDILRSGLS